MLIEYVKMEEKYVESAVELIAGSYVVANPIYVALGIPIEELKDYLRPTIADPKKFPLDIVGIDKNNNNKLVAVKI
jgi:hypothetical protein